MELDLSESFLRSIIGTLSGMSNRFHLSPAQVTQHPWIEWSLLILTVWISIHTWSRNSQFIVLLLTNWLGLRIQQLLFSSNSISGRIEALPAPIAFTVFHITIGFSKHPVILTIEHRVTTHYGMLCSNWNDANKDWNKLSFYNMYCWMTRRNNIIILCNITSVLLISSVYTHMYIIHSHIIFIKIMLFRTFPQKRHSEILCIA